MNFIQQDKDLYGRVGVYKMAKTIKSKYTVDDIPVKDIMNGVIVLDNGLRVTGVKIQPRNIFILDQQMQDAIIANLKTFYNMIDYEFWLVVADRPVDISVYMSQMQLLLNSTNSPTIRKLILQDIEKGETFIRNNVVDTEYYFMFKGKDVDLLQKRVRQVINGLATCGLNASLISNSDLRLVLENFLNGGNTSEFGTVMPV